MHYSRTIARNTMILYIRMAIVMVINLYTVRVVFNALGDEDYGIYNAVAGIITMLECITSVLSTATQRFFSSCVGEHVELERQNVFSVSLLIFLLFSAIVVILGESFGLWFVCNKLVVPDSRRLAAITIYHFSIAAFVVRLLQTPYYAVTIAHEDLNYFAIISIIENVLKLIFAFFIPLIPIDSLVFYGLYLLIIPLFSLLLYYIIAKRKYKECSFRFVRDKALYSQMLSFSSWTLFGSVAGVGMNQVNTILTNLFFGPVVNAARAIAIQINSAVSALSSNVVIAIRPKVTSLIADGKNSDALEVFYFSSKFVFYCIAIVIIPLIIEMDIVIDLWLGKRDEQIVLFSQLILLYTFIIALGNPITVVIQAIGKVKEYFIPVEFFTLLCPVVTFVCFRLGLPASSAFFVMALSSFLSHTVRVIILKRYCSSFSIQRYFIELLIPGTIIIIIVSFLLHLISSVEISNFLLKFIVVLLCSIAFTSVLCYWLGLTNKERLYIQELIIGRLR